MMMPTVVRTACVPELVEEDCEHGVHVDGFVVRRKGVEVRVSQSDGEDEPPQLFLIEIHNRGCTMGAAGGTGCFRRREVRD